MSPEEAQLLNRWAREDTRLRIEFSTQTINGWGEGTLKEWDDKGFSFDTAACDFRILLPGCEIKYTDATLAEKPVLDTHSRQIYLYQLAISWPNKESVLLTEYQNDIGVRPETSGLGSQRSKSTN